MKKSKYLTMNEEFENSWKRFIDNEEKGIYPAQKDVFGKRKKVTMEEGISINDLCPTEMCNIFHKDDIAQVLIDAGFTFSLNYWSTMGRDRFCQFSVIVDKYKHHLEVSASGYGCGECIWFSKGFPEEAKFRIVRIMARNQIMDRIEYIKRDMVDRNKKGFRIGTPSDFMMPPDSTLNEEAIRDMYFYYARSIEDILNITKTYHMIRNKKFYSTCSMKKEFAESIKRFRKEWAKLIKKDYYKEFLKIRSKLRAEYRREANVKKIQKKGKSKIKK